jgi:CRISPR-associated protein Cas1
LHRAWKKVRSNGGSGGGDGVSLQTFARMADTKLRALRFALLDGSYRPEPLRHARLTKPDGAHRDLAIPSIVDRVAQTAVLNAITPELDRRMSTQSFAYRPGRSVGQALALARRLVASGHVWIVDADIARFFDSVPHAKLIQELTIWIEDEGVLGLIARWLAAFAPGGRGLPQGAPLSPLLANLYLHPLDRILAASGISAVRYADDFVLLLTDRGSAEAALRLTGNMLRERGLALNPAKTAIVPASTGVRFLGQVLRTSPWWRRALAWLCRRLFGRLTFRGTRRD